MPSRCGVDWVPAVRRGFLNSQLECSVKSDFIYTQKQNKLSVAGLEDSSGTLRGKLPKHFQLAPVAEDGAGWEGHEDLHTAGAPADTPPYHLERTFLVSPIQGHLLSHSLQWE